MSTQTIDFRSAFLTAVAATAPATGGDFETAIDVWDTHRPALSEDVDGVFDPEFLTDAECDERAGYHYPQN